MTDWQCNSCGHEQNEIYFVEDECPECGSDDCDEASYEYECNECSWAGNEDDTVWEGTYQKCPDCGEEL